MAKYLHAVGEGWKLTIELDKADHFTDAYTLRKLVTAIKQEQANAGRHNIERGADMPVLQHHETG